MADDRNIEKEPQTGIKNPETAKKLKEAKEQFESSETFAYLTENLDLKNNLNGPTKSKEIIDKITSSFQNLSQSKEAYNKTLEKLEKNYKFEGKITKEQLAIVDAVENKIGNKLGTKDKLELIMLLGGFEVKQNNDFKEILDKNSYSPEMLNHPKISEIEGLYLKGAISSEVFSDFIKQKDFKKAVEGHEGIKELLEQIEKNNELIDFYEVYGDYIPEEMKDSFIIKYLEKNFIGPIEVKEPNAKKYNLFVSFEKALNNFLKEHKYFYKTYTYYDKLEVIRKVPEKTETIKNFFYNKLSALAYIMALAGERPFEIEEKHQEAGEQQKAVEAKQQTIEQEKHNNPVFERILKLYKKNEEKGQNEVSNSFARVAEVRELERQERLAANNPYYNPSIPSNILPEKKEVA